MSTMAHATYVVSFVCGGFRVKASGPIGPSLNNPSDLTRRAICTGVSTMEWVMQSFDANQVAADNKVEFGDEQF